MCCSNKEFLLKGGEKIVFIGDSITDCGRRDQFAPYGNGYVKLIIDLLTASYPDRNFIYFNKGIGGHTVEDLFNRWYDDVVVVQPDWVSVLIGINDLHRGLGGNDPNQAIPPEKYERIYQAVLERTKKETKAKLILLEPFYISSDLNDGTFRSKVLKLLPEYIAVVHKMAKKFDTLLVRTHQAFQEQIKYNSTENFCPEPVHPNLTGHLVMAYQFLRALNF